VGVGVGVGDGEGEGDGEGDGVGTGAADDVLVPPLQPAVAARTTVDATN